jgi:cell wall-associated NlpC family hydrolase
MNVSIFNLVSIFLLLFTAGCGKGRLVHDYYFEELEAQRAIRSDIVKVANKYLGIPYKEAGRNPKTGFDCSGLITYVYDQVNIDFRGSAEAMSKFGVLKDKSKLEAGDLVYFGENKKITHMGIIVSNTKNGLIMVHSSSSQGVSKVDLNTSSYWKPLYLFGKDIFVKTK